METFELNRLIINLLERKDLEKARQLHNESSTLYKLSDVDHVSEIEQEKWFESLSLSKKSRRYVVKELSSLDFVGVVRVDQIDLNNRSVCVGLDITPEKRGMGYATEVYDWILEYFFNQKGMNRIYLATLETNNIALNLYKKLGFKVEGVSRSAIYRDGRFLDLIWMSLLQSEFRGVEK